MFVFTFLHFILDNLDNLIFNQSVLQDDNDRTIKEHEYQYIDYLVVFSWCVFLGFAFKPNLIGGRAEKEFKERRKICLFVY